jgi:MinD-like ATPase involved in chromosome partitioning or flagellar assembly
VTLNASVRMQLAEQLRSLPVDVVVVDVGAGVGYDPVDLLELGHRRLVVSSCEPSAVQDAYALFKAAVRRVIHRHLAPAGQLGLLEPGLRTWEGERMNHVLGRVQRIDPVLHAALTRDLANFGGALLGTQVMDIGHIGALQALSALAAEYLGVTVPLLGWLPNGARLPDLAGPHDDLAPDGAEAQALRAMAEALLRPSPAPGGSEPERRRPMVYVRPPRRRLREPTAASEPSIGRRPRPRLPGMPPRAAAEHLQLR